MSPSFASINVAIFVFWFFFILWSRETLLNNTKRHFCHSKLRWRFSPMHRLILLSCVFSPKNRVDRATELSSFRCFFFRQNLTLFTHSFKVEWISTLIFFFEFLLVWILSRFRFYVVISVRWSSLTSWEWDFSSNKVLTIFWFVDVNDRIYFVVFYLLSLSEVRTRSQR